MCGLYLLPLTLLIELRGSHNRGTLPVAMEQLIRDSRGLANSDALPLETWGINYLNLCSFSV